ncbi:MAG: extracellular solute-binding protein [Patescibacteria group bacterium]|nr:extracellular solute-binding protein [Patescibacteria group bacterium]
MDKRYWILGGAVVALIVIGTLYFLSSRKNTQTKELTFVTYNEDEKNLSDYTAAFETANNVKINFKKIDPKNYELESLNLLSTGKVDIWGMPSSWIPKQHAKLAPYTGKLTTPYQSLYPKIVASENIINDKIYGLPISLDTLVLFVNNDIKAKNQDSTPAEDAILSAEPKTWDDLVAKNPLLQSGAALGTADLAAAPDILTVLMLQNGTQMTNQDNTQATFHTALNTLGGASFPGAAALNLYTSFAKNNKTTGDPLTAFTNGKAAFYIDYSAKESDIIRLNPNLNYSIRPLPQVKASKNPINFTSYETFTVPNASKNQALAWQFLIGLANKDNLKTYFETSKKHPALMELADQSDVVDQAVQTAQSWYNPEPTEVAKIFRDAITQVVSGQKAQTTLDGAAVQVTTLLGKIEN